MWNQWLRSGRNASGRRRGMGMGNYISIDIDTCKELVRLHRRSVSTRLARLRPKQRPAVTARSRHGVIERAGKPPPSLLADEHVHHPTAADVPRRSAGHGRASRPSVINAGRQCVGATSHRTDGRALCALSTINPLAELILHHSPRPPMSRQLSKARSGEKPPSIESDRAEFARNVPHGTGTKAASLPETGDGPDGIASREQRVPVS